MPEASVISIDVALLAKGRKGVSIPVYSVIEGARGVCLPLTAYCFLLTGSELIHFDALGSLGGVDLEGGRGYSEVHLDCAVAGNQIVAARLEELLLGR